jgi:hypothetical protein
MSRPAVNFLFNLGLSDVPCTNPAGDSNFLLLASGDYLVWRDSQQMGGDLLTGPSYPTVIPVSGSIEGSKLFIMDVSEGTYRQVPLAGNSGSSGGGDYRYVCCAWFGGATATIPFLEAYDDNTHSSWESKPLGDGVAANSSFRAICTTNAAPGSASWAGTPLAGLYSRIELDTAALAATKYLYWNMRHVLSDWMESWSTADWYNTSLVLCVHYTYS